MCLLGERCWELVGTRNGGANAAPPFPLSKQSFFSLPYTQTHTHTHWPSLQNTQSKNSLQGGVGPAIIITRTSHPPLPRKGTRLMLFLVQAIKKLFVTCLALMFGPLAQDYRGPLIRPPRSWDGQMRDGREETADRRMGKQRAGPGSFLIYTDRLIPEQPSLWLPLPSGSHAIFKARRIKDARLQGPWQRIGMYMSADLWHFCSVLTYTCSYRGVAKFVNPHFSKFTVIISHRVRRFLLSI